jgi:hypothetical protein
MRLLECLEAAQAEGGDLRGMMSSAIRVAGDSDDDRLDLRVDDDAQPLAELRRLLQRAEAANHVARAREIGPGPAALAELDAALALAPDQDEYRFWKAVVLIHLDHADRAREIIAREVADPELWRRLLVSLSAAGLVALEDSDLRGFLLAS